VRVPSPCKRAGVSSIPPIGLMPQRWCGRSTSSSTLSSTAWRSKIASMIDEHTRESLLNLVERSITAERLVTELAAVVAAVGGPPTVLRLDHGPPGCPWDNGYLESFNNRLRKECLDRNHWTTLFEARGGHRRRQTRAQPPTPAFGPGRPNAGRVGYGKQAYPHPGGLRDLLNPKHNNPTLIPGGLSNRDSPRAREVEDLPRPVAVKPSYRKYCLLRAEAASAQLGSPHAVITSTLCGPHSGTRRVGESKLLRTSWLPMSPAPRKLRKALRTIGTHVTECIDVARLPPTQLVESRQVSWGQLPRATGTGIATPTTER
jgi:hypothetical protein